MSWVCPSDHCRSFPRHTTTWRFSSRQRVALAEEALDALCEAIDPCLIVQPAASLAQYGNARLKVRSVWCRAVQPGEAFYLCERHGNAHIPPRMQEGGSRAQGRNCVPV